jgi:hypothetical protein
MKIPSVHNSYHAPAVEDQVSTHEIDPLRCQGHLVLLYQAIRAIQTLPLGTGK